jgi:hypothetical protein
LRDLNGMSLLRSDQAFRFRGSPVRYDLLTEFE